MSATVGEQIYKPLLASSIFYPLLAICGILTLIHFWQQSLRHVKMGNKLPGPTPLPVVGNALEAFMLGPNGK